MDRNVFADRPDRTDPPMNAEEYTTHRGVEAARLSELPLISRLGLMMGGAAAVDRRRAGVRDDLAANMERRYPGQPAVNQIIDHKVTLELKSMFADQESEERQQAGFWGRRIGFPARGAWNRITGFFRGDERGGRYAGRMEQVYGQGLTTQEKTIFAAREVMDGLTVPERNAVQNYLVMNGLPFPGPPGVAVPAGVPPQVFHLSQATPDQLASMQTQLVVMGRQVFAQPVRDVLFPPREEPMPNTPFGRLLRIRHVEAQARYKSLSTNIYDPQRLQIFMDNMETASPDLHKLVIDMLEENALYGLENLHVTGENQQATWDQKEIAARTAAPAQALIAHLEYLYNERGPAAMHILLRAQRDALAAAPVPENAENLTPEQQRVNRINQLVTEVQSLNSGLQGNYGKAATTGTDLYNLDRQRQDALAAISAGSRADVGLTTIQSKIAEKTELKNQLAEAIETAEKQYRIKAPRLADDLRGVGIAPPPRQVNDYLGLIGGPPAASPYNVPPNNSTEIELFGDITYVPPIPPATTATRTPPTPSPLGTHIVQFNDDNFKEMGSEIKEQYIPAVSARVRLTPRQLLYLLKEAEVANMGQFSEEQQRRYALMSANLMVSDAANIQLQKSYNHELAERLGETTLGMRWLSRAGKWATASLTHDKVYRARDIIDHLGGLDKEFKMFRGMPADMTLTELRDRITESGGIKDEKLFEFITKLSRTFMSFEVAATRGKVELYDNDARNMHHLIENLNILMEEQRSRETFASLRGQPGEPGQNLLNKIRESEAAQLQEQQNILTDAASKIKEWGHTLYKSVMKSVYGDRYKDARGTIKEMRKKKKDISKGEIEDFLSAEGLLSAAGVLATPFAVAETLSSGKKALFWTGRTAGKGAALGWRGAAATGRGLGRGTMAVGRGVGKVAGGTWRRILKPLGYHTIVWPVKTVGRVVAAPFVLAGGLLGKGWRWVKA